MSRALPSAITLRNTCSYFEVPNHLSMTPLVWGDRTPVADVSQQRVWSVEPRLEHLPAKSRDFVRHHRDRRGRHAEQHLTAEADSQLRHVARFLHSSGGGGVTSRSDSQGSSSFVGSGTADRVHVTVGKAGSSPATDVRRIPHRRRRCPKRRACGMGLILQLLVLSSHFRDVADGVLDIGHEDFKSRHISGAEALGNHPSSSRAVAWPRG